MRNIFLIIFLTLCATSVGWTQARGHDSFYSKILSLRSDFHLQQEEKPQLPQSESVDILPQKHIGRAVLLSMLLPGLGESYLGHGKMGKFFITLDAGFWGMLWGSRHFENIKLDDSRSLARQQAGVGEGHFDEQFWIQVGRYSDVFTNNDMELINRNIENVYEDTDLYYWNWSTDKNRIKYSQLRSDANSLSKLGDAVVMGLVVNRLASILNILRISKLKKNDPITRLGIDWKFNSGFSMDQGSYVGINFVKYW